MDPTQRYYKRHVLHAALLLALVLAAPASAERSASHPIKACGLTGTDTSVVVDVYDDASPGSILATILNAEVTRIGTTDCYQADLATTTAAISYPASGAGTEKGYTAVFRDDATNEIELTEQVRGIVGADGKSRFCEREVPVYATVTIPSRGITATTIAQGKPNYVIVEVDCTHVFTSPSATWYEVYSYDSFGRVAARTPSPTVPNP